MSANQKSYLPSDVNCRYFRPSVGFAGFSAIVAAGLLICAVMIPLGTVFAIRSTRWDVYAIILLSFAAFVAVGLLFWGIAAIITRLFTTPHAGILDRRLYLNNRYGKRSIPLDEVVSMRLSPEICGGRLHRDNREPAALILYLRDSTSVQITRPSIPLLRALRRELPAVPFSFIEWRDLGIFALLGLGFGGLLALIVLLLQR